MGHSAMTAVFRNLSSMFLFGVIIGVPLVAGQDEKQPPPKGEKKGIFIQLDDKGPPGGKGGFGGPMMGQQRKLIEKFDKDGDKRLNREERQAARESMKKEGGGNRGPFGKMMGGPFGKGNQEPPKPGPKVEPNDVQNYPSADLYDPKVLRTVFLNFEDKDWEAELADFYHTDVEVPATMIVDGKTYPNVGVHFRGASSYFAVGAGFKRSLGLSLDYADKKQKLHKHHALNFLNSHDDPSYMSTILYSQISQPYVPTPKANLVKVVINGESWGIYVNVEQFNKEFIEEHFKTGKGARWKVRGSPGGGGGLEFTGDNVENYKRRFEIKSNDDEKSWKSLINLCKVLNQTPPDKLEEALKPILDVDSLLWFLAIDNAVINCDGYWIRASDYSIYMDPKGKFHVIPHDMNECFRPPMGPGMGGPGGGMMFARPRPGDVLPAFLRDMLELNDEQKKQVNELQKEADDRLSKILTKEQQEKLKNQGPPGGPGGGPGGPGGGIMARPAGGPTGGPGMAQVRGVELDPLVGLDDPRKPLRSKILAVPKFREQYLRNMRTLAEKAMTWEKLGPVVANYRTMIEKEVEIDTRKLDSIADFKTAMADPLEPEARRSRTMNIRQFIDQRRNYLLNHPEIKKVSVAAAQ